MPAELLLVLLVVLVPIVEWFMRMRREWAKRQPPVGQRQGQGASQGKPPRDTREHVRAAEQPRPPREARRHAAAVVASAGTSRADATRLAHLGSHRDLRRAVVLMAVLGPCRAEQPHAWPGTGR